MNFVKKLPLMLCVSLARRPREKTTDKALSITMDSQPGKHKKTGTAKKEREKISYALGECEKLTRFF